jgi:hypothetical protein
MLRETKIFDPRDGSTGSSGEEVSDSSVVKRGDRWWMFLGGQAHGFGPTDIFSASLPAGAPLTATGWQLTRGLTGELQPVAGRSLSQTWDGNGGRHCPSYVRGWDAGRNAWIERIYYAGAAQNLWGPYTIGFLEWDGERWADQPEPAFLPKEDWEHGSVFEPNLIYHEGKWKMWYVAGSHQEDYLVHGYSESADGRTNWSKHEIFAPPEMRMFDFCVRPRGDQFEAIFSRVWVSGGIPAPGTGLWHCRATLPAGRFADWSEPVQIMSAADRGWHSGPWKPSLQFDEQNPARALVFFNGLYRTNDPGPFPFAFTLGCLEIDLSSKAPAAELR